MRKCLQFTSIEAKMIFQSIINYCVMFREKHFNILSPEMYTKKKKKNLWLKLIRKSEKFIFL